MKKRLTPLLLVLLLTAVCAAVAEPAVPEADYAAENAYMQLAIDEARDGIHHQHGGPFGSVIVRDGEAVGRDQLGDYLICVDRDACLKLFDEYTHMDRTIY